MHYGNTGQKNRYLPAHVFGVFGLIRDGLVARLPKVLVHGQRHLLLVLVEHLDELAELPAPPLGRLGLALGERRVGGRDD